MSNQLTGIDAEKSYSYAKIESISHGVREKLALDSEAALDAQDFFEFHLDDIVVICGSRKVPLRHGVVELTTEALTRWDPDTERMEVLLSEDSYSLLCNGHPRPKYTIGHELGHAILHAGQLIKLAELNAKSQAAMHRGKADHPAYRDTEWQANAFAGAFVIPARGIKRFEEKLGRLPRPSEVAAQYGVSQEVASYRLDIFERGKTGLR